MSLTPIIYKIHLDCGKSGNQASIYVKKGDVKTWQLSIFLYNNSIPYELAEDATVVLRAVKPDGTLVYNDCTISGNIIKHLMPAQMMTATGTVECELDVYGSDNEVLFSPEFSAYISDVLASDDDVVSSSKFSALTAAMTNIPYTFIKYAAFEPSQDSDIKDTPDAWIGIYVGNSHTAPTKYSTYSWYRFRDDIGTQGYKGDQGDVSSVDGVSPDSAGNVQLIGLRRTGSRSKWIVTHFGLK